MPEIINDNWQDVPDPLSVRLHVKDGASLSPLDVGYSLRREVTTEDTVRDPAILKGSGTVWHLYADKIPGAYEPKAGDKIEYGGVFWTVRRVQEQSRSTRFRLTCLEDKTP